MSKLYGKGMFVISLNNIPYLIVYDHFIQLCSKCFKRFKVDVENMDYCFFNVSKDVLGIIIYESYEIDENVDLPFCVMCHVNPTEYLGVYKLEFYEFKGEK